MVLVNDGSASASEIVASALQDNGRAAVVGERSYGKGSVQKLLSLGAAKDSPAVKLTTETYWRPSGKNMDKKLAQKDGSDEWGVTPEVIVTVTPEERFRGEVEVRKSEWTAGKPSVVGPNPPKAPDPKTLDGKPLTIDGKPIDLSKPWEDRQLKAAAEVVKKKLGGTGAVPSGGRLPKPIAG